MDVTEIGEVFTEQEGKAMFEAGIKVISAKS